jgi:septum site-determining protein MinD
MGRVYAVASGKGGVGKTTTVANLGAALAEAGHETVVVDVDLGMGNLAGVLGVDVGAGPTVHDVLAGSAMVAEAVRSGPTGLSVLPASAALDDFGTADPTRLGALLDGLGAEFVLLDTSAGLSHDSVEPLRIADEVVLVSTPQRGALGDTAKTREVADRFDTPVWGAVVTRTTTGTDVRAVADGLGVTVRGTIPDDPAVSAAAEAGDPLVVAAPDAPATAAYRRLAAELSGDDAPTPAPADVGGEGVVVADAEAVAQETNDDTRETGTAGEDRTEPVTLDGADAGDGPGPADAGTSGTESDADGSANEAGTTDDGDAEPERAAESTDEAEDETSERSGFLRWLLG